MKQIKDYPRYYATINGEIWDDERKCYVAQYFRSKNARYMCVSLKKNGKQKLFNVHRLIAETFIDNPLNLPEVNHKDEDPTNNRVDNLEWCSRLYNNNYGTRNKRSGESQLNRPDVSKRVVQYDLAGNVIAHYPSVIEAHRQTGASRSAISKCCKKLAHYYTAGGYRWEWEEVV